MIFTQIRHGSHIIQFNNKRFLIDPVFAEKGSMFSLPKGRIKEKNPLTNMPFDKTFLTSIDCVLITHLHFDHFDEEAINSIAKETPIYCHRNYGKKIKKLGFKNVHSFEDFIIIDDNIKLSVISKGEHGKGISKILMGQVTGFIFESLKENSEPTVYIVGDSIWCNTVRNTLEKFKPSIVVAFAGSASLPFGKPITMGTYDLDKIANYSFIEQIIVNHMDTWNHCFLTRTDLKQFISDKPYQNKFVIPDDGENINIQLSTSSK